MSPKAFAILVTLAWLLVGGRALADDLDLARSVLKEAEANLRACGEKPDITADLWAELGKAQARCGDQRDAIETLNLAWKMAHSIRDDSERHNVQRTIARGQIHLGQLERVLLDVKQLPLYEDQSYALIWIVNSLGQRGDLTGALRVAGLIRAEDAMAHVNALHFAGFAALEKNDLDAALKVCELLPVPSPASKAPGDNSGDARPAIAHADALSESIRSRNLLLYYVAQHQARAGRFDDAARTMKRITEQSTRESTFGDIAKAAGDAGRLETARKLLSEAPTAGQKDGVLEVIAKALAKVGRTEEAYQTVDQIRIPDLRSRALLKMAAVFAGQGAEAPFWRAYNAALRSGVKENLGMLGEGEKECVRAFLKANCVGQAVSIAEHIQDPDLASRVWQAIGMRATEINDEEDAKCAFEQSCLAANRLEELEFRLGCLNELAAAQARSGDKPGASAVFKSVCADLPKFLAGHEPDIIEALRIATTEAILNDRQGPLKTLPAIADAAERHSDPNYRRWYLNETGETYARVGEREGGVRFARRLQTPIDRVRVLLGVAKGLVANSKKEPLLEILDPLRREPD